jgi:hypothetical protein
MTGWRLMTGRRLMTGMKKVTAKIRKETSAAGRS